ncbi:hypothetical protein Aperf_G00000122155 [Anoplocephala perfoliata]
MSNNVLAETIGTVLLPSIGSFMGDLVILVNLNWYESLRNASLSPPTWVHALIRTISNLTLGLASYIVVRQGDNGVNVVSPPTVYFIQLLLNWSWPIVFFGLKNFNASVAICVALAVGAAITTYLFNGIDTFAGKLLYPYTAWMIFGLYMNMSIAYFNLDGNAKGIAEPPTDDGKSKTD